MAKSLSDFQMDAIHLEGVEGVEKPPTEDADKSRDIAAKIMMNVTESDYTHAERRSLLRHVDMVMMPLMFISYGLQYMDKALLSNAAQFGIIQDLSLYKVTAVDGKAIVNSSRYSYVTLIFYWGYAVGCFPALYLAQRLPLGKYAGVSIVVWGVVTMTTAGVTSYPGFMVQRLFLGVCEAAIAPAFSLITAMWYKSTEQPLRFAFWYAVSGFGGCVGSLASWGIGHISGSLRPWQYQYLILGAITVVWGLGMIRFLPDNPIQARFLSDRERILAVERMRAGQTGIENSHFKLYQAREALLDIKTWLMVLMVFCTHLVNAAVTGFGSIIVSGFGFNPLTSVLLLAITGGLVFTTLVLAGTYSVFVRNQRCNILVLSLLPVVAGSCVIWKGSWTNIAVPLVGFYLLAFFACSYVMTLSLMAANTAGHTKKAVTAGLIWATYCISNGVAPLLVKTSQAATHYPTLFEPLLAFLGLNIMLGIITRVYLQSLNKKRDTVAPVEENDAARTAFEDLTDHENPNFRYSW